MLKCEKKVSLEFLFHRKAFLSVFCIRIISVVDVSASQAGKRKKKEGERQRQERGERKRKKKKPHQHPVSQASRPSFPPRLLRERKKEGKLGLRTTRHVLRKRPLSFFFSLSLSFILLCPPPNSGYFFSFLSPFIPRNHPLVSLVNRTNTFVISLNPCPPTRLVYFLPHLLSSI